MRHRIGPVVLATLLVPALARPGAAGEAAAPAPLRASVDRYVEEAVRRASGDSRTSDPHSARPIVCEAGCANLAYPVHDEPSAEPQRAGVAGALVGLALGVAGGTATGSDDLSLRPWRGADYAVLGAGLAAWVAPKLLDKDSPELGHGLFSDCHGSGDGLWSIDRRVRNALAGDAGVRARERAARWSDATLLASAFFPIGLAVGSEPPHRERDMLVTLETLGVSMAVNSAVKHIFDRPRPYAHFCEPAHPGDLCARDAQLSFYSGHTSTSFAAAVVAGRLADMHGRGRAGIWITGLTLATTTGILRIKADKHYLTDVVVGAVAGGLAGWLLPPLHAPEADEAPVQEGGRLIRARVPPPAVALAVPGRAPGTGLLIHAGVGDGVSLGLSWQF